MIIKRQVKRFLSDCLYAVLLVFAMMSCCHGKDPSGIYQDKRQNVINVKDNIEPLNVFEITASAWGRATIKGNYILISDWKSPDKLIHIFDKNTFQYLRSIGNLGQGPGEISNLGSITMDEDKNILYVIDRGGQRVFNYTMDSVMLDECYQPYVKQHIGETLYPYDFEFVNDSLFVGVLVERNSPTHADEVVGLWNVLNGNVVRVSQDINSLKIKRIAFDYSKEKDLLVVCNQRYDLMTLMDGDLQVKKRIYGPSWDGNYDGCQHFVDVVVYKDFIVASYDGTPYTDYNYPLICHVFDLEGNYIKTLDIGIPMTYLSVDEDNDRLYFTFDDEMQFGYLDLKGLL